MTARFDDIRNEALAAVTPAVGHDLLNALFPIRAMVSAPDQDVALRRMPLASEGCRQIEAIARALDLIAKSGRGLTRFDPGATLHMVHPLLGYVARGRVEVAPGALGAREFTLSQSDFGVVVVGCVQMIGSLCASDVRVQVGLDGSRCRVETGTVDPTEPLRFGEPPGWSHLVADAGGATEVSDGAVTLFLPTESV